MINDVLTIVILRNENMSVVKCTTTKEIATVLLKIMVITHWQP